MSRLRALFVKNQPRSTILVCTKSKYNGRNITAQAKNTARR